MKCFSTQDCGGGNSFAPSHHLFMSLGSKTQKKHGHYCNYGQSKLKNLIPTFGNILKRRRSCLAFSSAAFFSSALLVIQRNLMEVGACESTHSRKLGKQDVLLRGNPIYDLNSNGEVICKKYGKEESWQVLHYRQQRLNQSLQGYNNTTTVIHQFTYKMCAELGTEWVSCSQVLGQSLVCKHQSRIA